MKHVDTLFLAVLAAATLKLQAETSQLPQAPLAWADSLHFPKGRTKTQPWPDTTRALLRLVCVHAEENWLVPVAPPQAANYLEFTSLDEAALIPSLSNDNNDGLSREGKLVANALGRQKLIQQLGVDGILELAKSRDKVMLYGMTNSDAPILIKEIALSTPAANSQFPDLDWVSLLGYGGVVLASSGDIVLAQTKPLEGRTKIQAIAYLNSAADWIIKDAQRSQVALLSLVANEGRYSAVRVVLGNEQKLELSPGTKLLLSD